MIPIANFRGSVLGVCSRTSSVILELGQLIDTEIEELESGRKLAIARCEIFGFFGVSPCGDIVAAKKDLLTTLETFLNRLNKLENLQLYLKKIGFTFCSDWNLQPAESKVVVHG